jgi:hypothetical protein
MGSLAWAAGKVLLKAWYVRRRQAPVLELFAYGIESVPGKHAHNHLSAAALLDLLFVAAGLHTFRGRRPSREISHLPRELHGDTGVNSDVRHTVTDCTMYLVWTLTGRKGTGVVEDD